MKYSILALGLMLTTGSNAPAPTAARPVIPDSARLDIAMLQREYLQAQDRLEQIKAMLQRKVAEADAACRKQNMVFSEEVVGCIIPKR